MVGHMGRASKATTAFLKRRVHHQRMRAASMRALKAISLRRDECLDIDFDDSAELIGQAMPWISSFRTDVAALRRSARTPRLAPRLAVVIMVVGSRGDVQPFIPIGQRIARRHRVRIATHAEFRPLVEKAGLEFYPLAGDPRELMDYMVRTGGRIIPTQIDQLIEDVPRKREIIKDILASTWRACTEPDPEHSEDSVFLADAIIANPPSYGHIHCAEALSIPLHMVFTMPWAPTSAFPHPLARLTPGAHQPVRNWLSYHVIDALSWAGLGDLINEFREQTLGLPPLSSGEGASLLNDAEVPYTYLWPASLMPKPEDWGPHIDLANFVFLDQAQDYTPPPELEAFLAAGEKPIYVGFGSCVVEDPERLTATIFEALERAGARGIVSRGWGDLGTAAPPPHVYLVGDCPHDWLFPRCRAVCHHGGAGTTAAGLRAGLPTVVVPFFGDQFFWGQMIADAGAGPQPIPIGDLTTEALAEAFAACARPEKTARAQELGAHIRAEDGVELVVDSLTRHLPLSAMQCALNREHLATRYCEHCRKRLCGVCAHAEHREHSVRPYRYVAWDARMPRTIGRELRGLISDAAAALRTGVGEGLTLLLGPRRDGVILGREEPAGAGPDRPLAKARRAQPSRRDNDRLRELLERSG